jgi:hypothetical protein
VTTPADFETRLRASLAKSEEFQRRAMADLVACDAHPNSNDYKTAERMALMASGQAMGLAEALGLLTGEEVTPDLRMPGT